MTYSAMCLHEGSTTDMAKASAVYDDVDTLPSLRDWGVTHMLGEWLVRSNLESFKRARAGATIDPGRSSYVHKSFGMRTMRGGRAIEIRFHVSLLDRIERELANPPKKSGAKPVPKPPTLKSRLSSFPFHA